MGRNIDSKTSKQPRQIRPGFLAILAILTLTGNGLAQDYDFDIGWISRSPKIRYVQDSTNPTRDGWPREGQIVKWQAHIRNWGTSNAQGVPYHFLLDGSIVQSGVFNIDGRGGKATIPFRWNWTFRRHDLTFIIDPDNRFKELEKVNNRLVVQTDAIAVGFYVEKSVYEYFQANQKLLKAGSNSWEDWAQRQILTLNSMYASAIYPESPNGVLDRLRIDKVQVVPDGSLPLRGGSGPARESRDPNAADRIADIVWGFPSIVLDGTTYKNKTSRNRNNPFYIEGSLLHEMNHVRYLIDVYLFRIRHNNQNARVEIQHAGQPVVGTSLMPFKLGDIIYESFEQGLMNQDYTFMDRYSAVALNLIAGYRARGEFANTIFNSKLGEFLNDIPAKNRIRLVTADGRPLAGAQADLFKAERGPTIPGGPSGEQSVIQFGNTPDFSLRTNDNGEILIKGEPFRKPGEPYFLTGISILRITYGNDVWFAYFELTAAQRAFWRGQRKEARYEFVIGSDPCSQAPTNLKAIHGSNQTIRFQWKKTAGAYGYVVWASIDRGPWKPLSAAFDTQLDLDVKGRNIRWYVEAYFDQCLKSTSVVAGDGS